MARLRVRLRGKVTQDLQLAPDRTYLAGRKDDCDIVLVNEKGISREHFKIFFAGDKWNLEVLSRFGDVLVNGEKIQQETLEGSKLFYLGPYEFEYSEVSSDLVAVAAPGLPEAAGPAYAEVDVHEKTFIGSNNTVPYIKVVNSEGDVKELFKLEGGDTWIAGRESSCDIVIRDQRVSRRQFEVRRQGSFFQIMDLGSVNGTLVNGNPVPATDPIMIKSGDAISVLDNHLYFELHDPDFKARMELVKSQAPNPLVAIHQEAVPMHAQYGQHVPMPMPMGEMPPAHLGYGYPAMGPGGYQQPPENKKFDFEKHRVKLIAGAVLLLGFAYFFSDQGEKPPPTQQQQGVAMKPGEAFNKLSPEQQILVKQTYMLAKNLYMQGKYELAKAEVTKIYELVPDYEDTKDIERLANEALVIQEQKRQQEQLEQKMAENREKIEKQIEYSNKGVPGESRFNSFLADIRMLDEHPFIGTGRNIEMKFGKNFYNIGARETHRNNGLGVLLSTYGVLFFGLWLVLLYKSFYKILSDNMNALMGVVLILIIGFSEDYFFKVFFIALVLYCGMTFVPAGPGARSRRLQLGIRERTMTT